ncbi:MAG TPA: DUF420 domain-containing protein [Parasegetibacter sp.]
MSISFPPSIFGARCDVLMDIVVVSMTMFVILFFVVLLFEYDMQQNGGIFAMVKGSAYEGTFFLNFTIYFHTFLSITTSIIWIYLIIASLMKFGGKNPRPGKFSKTHRLWGKIGMWDMALTCITGLILYVFGFYL